MTHPADDDLMRRALALAAAMAGRTGENPAVGCVIAIGDEIIAEGATGEGGRPHAEDVALAAAGTRARGACAYVTLEPCAKRSAGGRSCSELLAKSGVARVVIATRDPHPLAAGAGIAALEAAGVIVEIGLGADAARAINADFLARWGGP